MKRLSYRALSFIALLCASEGAQAQVPPATTEAATGASIVQAPAASATPTPALRPPSTNSPALPTAGSAVKPNASTKIDGVPSENPDLASEENYSFNPLQVKRDPFAPPAGVKGDSNDLTRFDLNEMNLVAVMTGMGAPQAMIILPNGKTHFVQEGTHIGRRNGVVAKIKSNEVQIKESFKDYQNRVKSDLTSLMIAE